MLVQLDSPINLLNGNVVVATAGTKVLLGAGNCVSVTIKALATNLGLVYVGNSTVSSSNGFQLSPGESVSVDIINLNIIYIDAQTSGEGVSYIAVN